MRGSRSVATVALLATVCFAVAVSAGPVCTCQMTPEFDFNGDGKSDLIRSDATAIRVDLLDGRTSVANASFANGRGRFALRAVGRFNGDDNADFVAQGGGHARVTLVNAAGTGTLGTLWIPDGGGTWQIVDAADVTGDGIDEILFADTGAAASAFRIANVASGSPVFSYVATGGGIWSYAFAADVNGDGHEDLLFRGSGPAHGVSRANLAGGNATVKYYSQGGGAWVLRARGDFDGNGTEDLADVANPPTVGSDRVRLFDTNGDPIAVGFVPNGGGFFTLRTAGDFTGDGKDDLAYDSALTFGIVAMKGVHGGTRFGPPNGAGTFTLRRLSDTNGDGFDDVISVNAAGDVLIQLAGHAETTTARVAAPERTTF